MRDIQNHILASALCAAAGLALAPLTGCSEEKSQPAPQAEAPPKQQSARNESGTWIDVRRGSVVVTTTAIGSLRSARTTRLGPQVSGRVAEVLVDVGDPVQKGQTLVRLDDTFFRIEIEQAEAAIAAQEAESASLERVIPTRQAEVESAEAALADADLNLRRMRNLWEKPEGEIPSIPKSRFDAAGFAKRRAAAGLDAAKSRLEESRAELTSARVELGEHRADLRYAQQRLIEATIQAPYDAVVTRRFVDPGEPVTATPVTHLVEVQDTRALELEFTLPQVHLASVGVGTEVTFEIDGLLDEPAAGRVSAVYPEIDDATRSVRCRVLVPNEQGKLRPGLLARVLVVIASRDDVLVVPQAALKRREDKTTVVVRTGDERAVREVVIGLTAGDSVEVVSGLADGERVLVATR